MRNGRRSRQVRIGSLLVGGGAPVSVQGMAKTDTRDVASTVAQIGQMAKAGCQLVRVAVPDMEAALALGAIKKRINIPLCADIHFDYKLALEALNQGVDKLRLNPGNIGRTDRIRAVVQAARDRQVPIRIGVNAGSLEKSILEEYGRTPKGLVASALRHVRILEDLDFQDIVISLKASDVPTMVESYKLIAGEVDYPLHLGVTEAGPGLPGIVKSAIGIGHLLALGIGDTLRVSVTGDPVQEIEVGMEILHALGLRRRSLEIVSCPTCGRLEYDLQGVVSLVQERVGSLDKPVKIAIMGCAVNGPGEAMEADIGLAGGKGVGVIYRKGTLVRKVSEDQMVDALLEEIHKL